VVVGRVISQKTSAEVREMLRQVVERGTGKRAMLADWEVAGKTGTSRKLVDGVYSETRHYSSFVGFAPADRPRAVALVIVDEPKGEYYGGSVAAPAVGALLGRTLAHLGVPRKPDGALAEAETRGARRGH
jgi:cell division protein FtsI/penicillin-binding protein 2